VTVPVISVTSGPMRNVLVTSSSNNKTDQCGYDDCNNVFSMAVGLARRWHSIALLRIIIVWRVCSSLHGCTGAGRLETRTARGAIGCC